MSRLRCALALAGCTATSGCASEQLLSAELFTVEAPAGATYPVMLSRTPSARPGRPLSASSGIYTRTVTANVTTDRNVVEKRGKAVEKKEEIKTVAVTRESDVGASERLGTQVAGHERWIQIDGIVFRAMDEFSITTPEATRELEIEATAHR